MEDDDGGDDAPVVVPLDGVLDLHTFAPSEVADLVAEYVEACADAGLAEVRLIHGKGTGTLRKIVQSTLARHPRVAAFRAGGEGEGGWGATVATLLPRR